MNKNIEKLIKNEVIEIDRETKLGNAIANLGQKVVLESGRLDDEGRCLSALDQYLYINLHFYDTLYQKLPEELSEEEAANWILNYTENEVKPIWGRQECTNTQSEK